MSAAEVVPNSVRAENVESQHKALQAELRELLDVVTPIQLIDLLIERCYQLRATDVHLDPTPEGLRVRIRIDGMLHDAFLAPPAVALQLVSRLKLLAGMDIAERRFAQDGRINHQVMGDRRDIRVGSGPTSHGERVVLRLMPESQHLRGFDALGLEPSQAAELTRMIRRPHGMVLSVGPVGTGKSTTMYNCLELLNSPSKSVVTIEDPVERRIPGVNQIQVESKLGFTFADALRAVMRQDADIMMIGEIRDPETASIAIRAGRSGVLVLSSTHANDTVAAIDVFRDYQIPNMFIADSIHGIVSQRLVRTVCKHCREQYDASDEECRLLGLEPGRTVTLSRGKGCDACFRTGYLGRSGIFELLPVDDDIRDAIVSAAPRKALQEIVDRKQISRLQDSCVRKVLDQKTTTEEFCRVLLAERS
jgi:type II secretory ATPase GspE/PulE/Tfp pilus assembly ATPase PilB-like protein